MVPRSCDQRARITRKYAQVMTTGSPPRWVSYISRARKPATRRPSKPRSRMSLRTLAQRRSRSASERVGGCLGGFGMALHYHCASSRQGGCMPDSVLPFDGARPRRRSLTMIRNWQLLLAAALLACCGAAGPAHAQSYPSRPITIVVPYPAGGVTDNLVRLLAERMKNSLGRSIVGEKIGGGGGASR